MHGEALLNWANTQMYLTINNLITHVDNLLFGRRESRVHLISHVLLETTIKY